MADAFDLRTIALVGFTLLASQCAYRAFFHPLRTIPGPLICRLTSLWIWYHSYIGDECSLITRLHERYGPCVRIAPNEVVISDGAALQAVYNENGGFMKAPCYSNFDIEGHSTIFSTADPAHRKVRSKAVLPLFGMGNINASLHLIEGSVDRMIERLKSEKERSQRTSKVQGKAVGVNVLNLTRSLAIDAVSSYLFGVPYGGISEASERLSASAYVDLLVAIGRFFFMPNWLFVAVDMAIAKLYPSKELDSSSQKIDDFVDRLVRDAKKEDGTYQSRLLDAGISEHETKIQLKDLMFAGTDSTGTNLGTLCWHMAKQPEIYQRLRAEISAADSASPPNTNVQNLPYLNACIREGLRISMANPTRLPRIVSPGGWTYTSQATNTSYHLPAGTQVGLQIYTLHFNPEVFSDPFAFKPERWLESPTQEMQRDAIAFGLGPRQCIARSLAQMELLLAVRAVAREGVLEGAKAVGERIDILEWFNSKIEGEKIELVWS